MEAAHLPWRPLGELFVSRGLISEAELETALAEQAATNRRLGEILVDSGLVSGPDLTSVLMEQLGVEISREEGFGSGLWAEIKRRHRRGGYGPDEENGEVEFDPQAESENPFVLLPGGAQDEPPATVPASDLGELEEELEELSSEYTPPPAIEALTEPDQPPVTVGQTVEADEAAEWVEPEQQPVESFELPSPVEEVVSAEEFVPAVLEAEPDEADPEPVDAAPEFDETAELRAELEAAETEIAHLHEMLADAMTALSALHAEARAAVGPTPRDHDSL